MKRIAIVTDSAASVPAELAREVELEIMPVGIQIDNQFHREGLDLTPEEFYALLEEKENVTTSQPSPGDFLAIYNKLVNKAKEIISIHITSRQSGTVGVAELVKKDIPIPITVVDSESASMGQGFVALAAARAALRGKSREEILEIIERVKQKTTVFVAVPTLKYLARSGKVGRVQAKVASLLTIKPILSVKNGLVQAVDKKRSYGQALQRMIALVEKRFPTEKLTIAVLHSNAPEKAEEFKQIVEERLRCTQVFIAEMGASLAVHGGQGMLGIAACAADEL
ncbi:MAG TPA: DegV family protein [Firmicutes bacterium]|nr:DegV family protein [Bacillota bacterium]